VYLALYARRAWVIFDHPYNADFARLVIELDRPRVERRAPSYGPCISGDRKAVPCNSRSGQETPSVSRFDGGPGAGPVGDHRATAEGP
jgi:hypothetical protein